MALNWAKFRHPYIFPLEDQVWTSMSAQRRAALDANGGDLVSPSVLPATLVNYFRPDGIRFTSVFPYITLPAEVPQNYGGSFLDQMYRTGSVVAFMPLLVLLTVWGAVSTFRRGVVRGARTLRIPLLSVAAIPGAIMFYGYIAMRYTAEFIPLFALAGTIAVIDIARRLADRPRLARPAFVALGVLAVFGFAANLAVSVSAARTANPGVPLNQLDQGPIRAQRCDPGAAASMTGSTARPPSPTTGPPIGSRSSTTATPRTWARAIPWPRGSRSRRRSGSGTSTSPPHRPSPSSVSLALADDVEGGGLQLEFDGEGRYRGVFRSSEEVDVGRWRTIPDRTLRLRLFAHLPELDYILVDLDKPKVGLVDLPMSQLDQTPYRQELVFRSGTFTDPPRAGIRITERDTPRPATCVALLERVEPAAG